MYWFVKETLILSIINYISFFYNIKLGRRFFSISYKIFLKRWGAKMEVIITETLDTLKEYIPKLVMASENIAENLQGGDHYEAMQQLPHYFEGIEWVVSALKGIGNNGIDFEIDTSSLNEYLIEVEEAIKHQDYILLADLLEYEFTPILKEWLRKVIEIAG